MKEDPFATLQRAWHEQGPLGALDPLTLPQLQERSRAHARRVWWRNAREWAAVALVVPTFLAWGLSTERWLVQAGCVWTALAAVWIGVVLWRRGTNLAAPAVDAPTVTFLRHERAQLERQAVLLERVPTWYVAPLAAGLVPILGDRAWVLVEAGAPRAGVVALGATVLLIALVFGGVLWLNRRAARELREQLSRWPDPDA